MKSENESLTVLLRSGVIVTLIVLSALLRILPHPWNLTPVGAMALFSGATFRNRWIAFLLPLASLFAADLFVGFHKLMLIVYASFAISVAIGRWLRENRSLARIGGAVFLGAAQFFVITNFAMWALGGYYPKTAAGLATCFVAGVPLFSENLRGDPLGSPLPFCWCPFGMKKLSSLRRIRRVRGARN